MKKYFAIAALACFSVMSAPAASLGYSDGTLSNSNIFRIGTSQKQGVAIKLGREKVEMLKGRTISTISAAFASSRTTTDGVSGAADLFIATSLDGAPAMSQRIKISRALKWLDFSLDKPYVITGDEPALYIGYTAEISASSKFLLSDFSADMQDCAFAFGDGKWSDTYGLGVGSPNIRFGIADLPDFTDAMIKPIVTDGYFKAETEYTLPGQLFNFGTQEINSFDLKLSLGSEKAQTIEYRNLSIAPNSAYDFTLPSWTSADEGALPLSAEIANVNGSADSTPFDNAYDTEIFCYPSAMERAILLEGFTGMDCVNCPSGHKTINSFLQTATSTPVIEVMHHAGYQPDRMTMKHDIDYTYFYGGTQTFAPAVMLNRTNVPTVDKFPMNVNANSLAAAYAAIEKTEPYASLSLYTEFDPQTRELTATLRTLAHKDYPTDNVMVNMMLIQDGIIASQTGGGDEYVHNAVFRGCLSDNAWGIALGESSRTPGHVAKWTVTRTIPEKIFSDYWESDDLSAAARARYSIPADIDNMYIVAYVSAYGNTPDSYSVYNAVIAKVGENYVQGGLASEPAIAAPQQPIGIRVEGSRIVVDGEYDSLTVTAIDGRQAPADANLAPGIYVVRAACGHNAAVKKVIVR